MCTDIEIKVKINLPCVSYSENILENAVIYVLDLTTGWR
jgi:hypothetical protein